MKMSDKLPGQIVKLIRQNGPMLSSDIAKHFGIGVDDMFNATRKPVRDKILVIEKVVKAGCKSRLTNLYKLHEDDRSIEDRNVINGDAHFDDVPKVIKGGFNPADPFGLLQANREKAELTIRRPKTYVYPGLKELESPVVFPSDAVTTLNHLDVRFPDAESCATILDNDVDVRPEFSCAMWLGGKEFHLRRGDNVFGVLTNP